MMKTSFFVGNGARVFGLGYNYKGYGPTIPCLFFKGVRTDIDFDNKPVFPTYSEDKVWGEPELAIIIGDYKTLFYTVACDVTCEEPYNYDHHSIRSKFGQNFLKLGNHANPYFKPKDQYVRGYLNGKLEREGKLSDRIFTDEQIIKELEMYTSLNEGDVILTGAPLPVFHNPVIFDHGDTYRCKIEGIKSEIKFKFLETEE